MFFHFLVISTNTSVRLAGVFRSAFLICFLFLGQLVEAQKIGFGPKAGINVSMFRGNFPVEGMRSLHFGFTVGGYLNVKFQSNKKWQIEVDLAYTSRGNNSSFFNYLDNDASNDDQRLEFKYNLGYIEVPVLFKYMLNRGGMSRPYLFFGPAYSGLIHANFHSESHNNRDQNAFDWIKRDDLGLMLGWGMTKFFIDRWYHIDLRYNHGFVDVSDDLANDLQKYRYASTGRGSFYNSTVSFTIGVGLERSETSFLR